MDFGKAVEFLKEGKIASRVEWNGPAEIVFVFRQVPSIIKMDIVPNMQSLPKTVKNEFQRRFNDGQFNGICYLDQLAIVKNGNQISGYSPSTEDALANDWFILAQSPN